MGFLDRLVSDMIRRETGFNPRRLVRRVGGKNILLLGGAALAGGMLAQQKSGSRASTGRGATGVTTLPPSSSAAPEVAPRSAQLPPVPPPVPGQGAATSQPPPLPPLPSASEELADAEEIPQPVLFAIVRTMVAAALADGELSANEKTAIDSRLAESMLSEAQIEQIRRDLVIPATVSELAAMVPEGEDPETLAEFAVLITRSDGELTSAETAWLRSLAAALGLPAHRIDVLTEEIFPNESS